MWTIIFGLASKLLNIFFPDKTPEKVARDDGYSAGVSAQKSTDQSSVLKDIRDAKDASNSVDAGLAHGVPVIESDGFRRD